MKILTKLKPQSRNKQFDKRPSGRKQKFYFSNSLLRISIENKNFVKKLKREAIGSLSEPEIHINCKFVQTVIPIQI